MGEIYDNKGLRTVSLHSKTIPKPFPAFLRLRCRICKKKASLIAIGSKPMCERCYEILNYEYKMTREYDWVLRWGGGEEEKLASQPVCVRRQAN
jgi:hypothetical protein